jgi:nicotinate phosphoribosyltransferase
MINDIYKTSLVLLTDLYQLTMAYGYFKNKTSEKEAVFHLFYRKNPFKGNYVVSAGLEYVVDYLKNFRFAEDDIDYLRALKGSDGVHLFTEDYLEYLLKMKFTCDVDAVPEGRVIFPHEPIIRIKGPIIQGQILETALLNIINFQSLIATKSSRICLAAGSDPVLEFGMRRAQGIDGSLSASRSAFIGGATSTSNVLAGKLFNIPLKGTHAHSWIMSFPSEIEAFESFAEVMPNNCVFLVDTYDTVEGIKNAITVGQKLKTQGHQMLGIRLDSGDLAELSITARKLLDEAGFKDADIVASNDLDEYTILDLKKRGAKINVWGIGTRLVTAHDQPALGGVYKIAAIKEKNQWVYKIKLSEDAVKVSNPGLMQVRRYFNDDSFQGDVIYNIEEHESQDHFQCMHLDGKTLIQIDSQTKYQDLLQPIFRKGQLVYQVPSLTETRDQAAQDLKMLGANWQKLPQHETAYPVGLETKLDQLKKKLIKQLD